MKYHILPTFLKIGERDLVAVTDVRGTKANIYFFDCDSPNKVFRGIETARVLITVEQVGDVV